MDNEWLDTVGTQEARDWKGDNKGRPYFRPNRIRSTTYVDAAYC